MFHVADVLHLEKEEVLHGVFRKHVATLVVPLILATLCIVIPFFFLFPLFRNGILGISVFSLSVLIGISVAMRAMYLWDARACVLTDRRLVLVRQEQLFSRVVTEVTYSTLRDVSWEWQGMWEHLFRMGSVQIRSTSQDLPIHLDQIPHPQDVAELLREFLPKTHAHEHQPTLPLTKTPTMVHAPSGDERRQKLDEIVSLLGRSSDEELDRFATILRARESERDST